MLVTASTSALFSVLHLPEHLIPNALFLSLASEVEGSVFCAVCQHSSSLLVAGPSGVQGKSNFMPVNTGSRLSSGQHSGK